MDSDRVHEAKAKLAERHFDLEMIRERRLQRENERVKNSYSPAAESDKKESPSGAKSRGLDFELTDDDDISFTDEFSPDSGHWETVGHRLYRTGQEMKLKLQKQQLRRKRETEMMELSYLKAVPSITQMARTLPKKGNNFAQANELWAEKVKRKVQKQQAESLKAEVSESKKKVAINKNSLNILKTKMYQDPYVGPVSGWEQRFAKHAARRAATPEPTSFSPNINEYSQTMIRGDDPFARLYTEAQQRNQKLVRALDRKQSEALLDPATGQPLFVPLTGRKDDINRRNASEIVEDLLNHGDKLRNRKEKYQTQQPSECTFKPRIDAASEIIAQQTSRKPLYSSRSMKVEESPTCSATPSARSSVDWREFERREQMFLELKNLRIEQMQKQKEKQIIEECQFKPRLCDHSKSIFYKTKGGHARSPESSPNHMSAMNRSTMSGRTERNTHRSRSAEPISYSFTAFDEPPAPSYQTYTRPVVKSPEKDTFSPSRAQTQARPTERDEVAETLEKFGIGGLVPSNESAVSTPVRSPAQRLLFESPSNTMRRPDRANSPVDQGSQFQTHQPVAAAPDVPRVVQLDDAPNKVGELEDYLKSFARDMDEVFAQWEKGPAFP